MTPWFIATQPFTPRDSEAWKRYLDFSGLTQLEEVVSLDAILCPPLLREIQDDYWPHIVNENFMLHFFLDFDFLAAQVAGVAGKNMLCVYRNPDAPPSPPSIAGSEFEEFMGYDLVDVESQISALTNCGGFPEVFANSELSPAGLLRDFDRALEVQQRLRVFYPDEPHANCHRWAIFRLLTPAPGA